ncbi:hypothetical protein [Vreelandella populi]|uniref:hypothetical protein n=1 Tax=Vreelandella populi TaxID=2498858 RepID=UPI000F8E55F6|nr:hypothetical protein [Halomonas populi]RUR51420.1 hypothetical protein ELY40_16610 [Halomonas populi]
MAFVVKRYASHRVPVEIHVPDEDTPSTIHATWKLLSFSDYRETSKQLNLGKMDDSALVERDLISLDDLKDEKGKPLEYSTELLDGLMELTFFRRALINSWVTAQECGPEARAKN